VVPKLVGAVAQIKVATIS